LLGKDLWLKERLTNLHKQFLSFSMNMGFHLWELDDEKKELRLRYLIHEDLRGKVHCLTKVFPFGEEIYWKSCVSPLPSKSYLA
jgi:competence protein CoiA